MKALTRSICIHPLLHCDKVVARALLPCTGVHLWLRGVHAFRKGTLGARIAAEDVIGACPLLKAVSNENSS